MPGRMKATAFFGVMVVTARLGFFTVSVIWIFLTALVESLRKVIFKSISASDNLFLRISKDIKKLITQK